MSNQRLELFADPPDKPSNISCSTNGLVTQMICCWDKGRETHLPTTYTLLYFLTWVKI